jgi:hypothetical protein
VVHQPDFRERREAPPIGASCRVVDELPSWVVALAVFTSIFAVVFGLGLGVFFMTIGGGAIVVGVVVCMICLAASILGVAVFVLSRRAEITVDDSGLVLRYRLLRREVRAERGRIAAVHVYRLPPVPPFGNAFWVKASGRWAVLPSCTGVWRVGGDSWSLPWMRRCGVGTQSVIVIRMTSRRWPLGIMTDHAEEVAEALAALLPPSVQPVAAAPRALAMLGRPPV